MYQLLQAILIAVQAHDGQRRQGEPGQPYAVHPIRVALSIMDAASSASTAIPIDILVAAVLHDTVEDADLDLEDIRLKFNEEVARLVQLLTDDPEWVRSTRKTQQAARVATGPIALAMVKVADQTDNLQDMLDSGIDRERVRRYLEGSHLVVQGAKECFERHDHLTNDTARDLLRVGRRLVWKYDTVAKNVHSALNTQEEAR